MPTRVGIPNFSYIRNKRDNDLETTKGNYTTIDGGVADSYFGSETDFGRLLIQNSTYYSIGQRTRERKFVLARSTRIGVETPFGNTFMPQPGEECNAPAPGQQACLPLAERFFAGGGNSHRGFGLNQAGPRDPTTGFPLGGTALFVNNIELRTPPPTLPFFQDNMSFAIFHDAGNVFTNGHDLFHNLLRWSQKNPQVCLQPGHRGAMRLQLHFACHRGGGAIQDAGWPGALRFRIQFESARVPESEDDYGQWQSRTRFLIPSTRAISTSFSALDRLSDARPSFPSSSAPLPFLAWHFPAAAAEVIDRIVATVNGHIILQSDWEDALRYEAFSSGRPLDQPDSGRT